MKILILHRYFWPDQANCGNILFNLAKHFQLNGYEIDILTSLPSKNSSSFKIPAKKKEKINQINIKRIKLKHEVGTTYLRIINAIIFGIKANTLAIKNKYDIIIATSVPPILGGFFASFAAKIIKSKFFYFCMDIYPEVGKVSGDFSNSLFFNFLKKIDNWSCISADNIIVHSKDMQKTLENRKNGKKFKIKIINNFSTSFDSKNLSLNEAIKFSQNNKLSMIFAGNIGRFQGLEIIIDAMSQINFRKDIQLMILGSGPLKKTLVRQANENKANIIFFDHQPTEIARKAIFLADIGLVTLRPEVYKYAYPGKVMTYLEQGKPIISNVEEDSELIKKMKYENYGFHISSTDSMQISKFFVKLADDKSWKEPMSKAAKISFEKNFSQKKNFQSMAEYIELKKLKSLFYLFS